MQHFLFSGMILKLTSVMPVISKNNKSQNKKSDSNMCLPTNPRMAILLNNSSSKSETS